MKNYLIKTNSLLYGKDALSLIDRDLLYSHLGSMGIINLCNSSALYYRVSSQVTPPPVFNQTKFFPIKFQWEQQDIKKKLKKTTTQEFTILLVTFMIHFLLIVNIWRTLPWRGNFFLVISIDHSGTWLSSLKDAYRDAICICYGWHSLFLPVKLYMGIHVL